MELFQFLAEISPVCEFAWDCGTGNGQAALPLARHFRKVIATDLSEKQLDRAPFHPRVEYRKATAERSGLAEKSIDLITVAQAFHWFHFESFFPEIRRIAKPGSHLAVWCYNLANHTPSVNEIVREFYSKTVGKFWDPERKYVEQGYANIEVPFREISTPEFEMTTDWSLEHLLGYLGTWSATQKWISEDPSENSIENLRESLKKAWGPDKIVRIYWPLTVRVFEIT